MPCKYCGRKSPVSTWVEDKNGIFCGNICRVSWANKNRSISRQESIKIPRKLSQTFLPIIIGCLYSVIMFFFGVLTSGGGHDYTIFSLGASPILFGFILWPILLVMSRRLYSLKSYFLYAISLLIHYVGLVIVVLNSTDYGGPALLRFFTDYWFVDFLKFHVILAIFLPDSICNTAYLLMVNVFYQTKKSFWDNFRNSMFNKKTRNLMPYIVEWG